MPDEFEIDKEQNVYLYRIVQTANKSFGLGSYKEFICVKATVAKITDYTLLLDYYYNGRLYHQEVPKTTQNNVSKGGLFIFWSFEKDDEKALTKCKEWLSEQIENKKIKVNSQAWSLMYDRDFKSTLSVHNI